MRIEELRPNLFKLPTDEAFKLFEEYYERRGRDLVEMVVRLKNPRRAKVKIKGKRKKKDEVTVSPSDLEMLKKLGLI